MSFEPLDRNNEPITDEFEELEFLPEQAADNRLVPDDTTEIIFTPEETGSPGAPAEEPPVSFSPAENESVDLTFDPAPLPDLGETTPFELVGTSLFDDAELEDDFDPFGAEDLDDDLEF